MLGSSPCRAQKLFVESKRRFEQVAPERPHPRHGEKRALADLGERVVHRFPCQAEAGLGFLLLRTRLRRAGFGLLPPAVGFAASLDGLPQRNSGLDASQRRHRAALRFRCAAVCRKCTAAAIEPANPATTSAATMPSSPATTGLRRHHR